MFNIVKAKELLTAADVFFGEDEDEPNLSQTLNMNDVWGWACSDAQYVPDNKLPEVAELFWRYGNAGILYWVSEQNDGMRSEFYDNNRFVDFVKHEEKLRKKVPKSSERAYKQIKYTLGS